MLTRTLGRSAIELAGVGLGCWAIGGPYTNTKGLPCGYGQIDDDESIRAIHRAIDLGATLLDTAPIYGAGHSERVIGRAVAGRRDEVLLATKFGAKIDEQRRIHLDEKYAPEELETACDESLARLGTDYIDLYYLHRGDYDPEAAPELRDRFERLVEKGKIRWYGWSTNDPARAEVFADGAHCTAIQHRLNVLEGDRAMLEVCQRRELASVNRTPLAKGLLSGKFTRETVFAADDVRRPWWNLQAGREARQLEMLEAIRDALTLDGRTLVQGAIGWLWAASPATIPIPGFKSVAQVEENVRALEWGPLSAEAMDRINQALQDTLARD